MIVIVIIYDNISAIAPYSNLVGAIISLERKERYGYITDEEWCIIT